MSLRSASGWLKLGLGWVQGLFEMRFRVGLGSEGWVYGWLRVGSRLFRLGLGLA